MHGLWALSWRASSRPRGPADAEAFPDVAISAMNTRRDQQGRGALTGRASVLPPPLQQPCGLGQFRRPGVSVSGPVSPGLAAHWPAFSGGHVPPVGA